MRPGVCWAYVQKMQVALHFGESVHVEQAGGSADLQELAEGVGGRGRCPRAAELARDWRVAVA